MGAEFGLHSLDVTLFQQFHEWRGWAFGVGDDELSKWRDDQLISGRSIPTEPAALIQ